MKFFRSIRVSEPRTPPDLYEAICALRPEGRRADFFFAEAKAGDDKSAQVVHQILAMCQKQVLKQTRGETVGSYVYSAARKYEPQDLKIAELLILSGGRGYLHDLRRNASGVLLLPAAQATPALKLKAAFTAPWLVVSEQVRLRLQGENLHGMEFRDVIIEGRSIRAADAPCWELTSRLTLPPMVNAVRYENIYPYPAYAIDDDSFQRPEPHYLRSQLQQMGAFDIARTKEPLGRPDPLFIISQRFYQVCRKHRIPVEAWPARIDAD